ncbi:hypothetical protein ABL78_7347 [Leptomonas seymouri]|uniref:Uncharacterized protein n=1 Tax=Leptomonas seymouri TaxID=5684 RepID=A0A0N0P316_LEPSE|nr:hypothetical protein ABL78_7347 [Leptomonas seymouri]|eukprot:KPI83609.1 hypothetical protein ABL78_7347 [Leptomonas seymouri]
MRQLLSCLRARNSGGAWVDQKNFGHPLSSTVFFLCGSNINTRKDALYITSLHRLLVECIHNAYSQAKKSPEEATTVVDVSLVTCYELWGVGDVLAPMPARQTSVTWLPLSSLQPSQPKGGEQGMAGTNALQVTPPSTEEIAAGVESQLRVWFQRVDAAAASWSQSPSTSPSALPLTAADKMHYVENNAVVCTLRFRYSEARPRHPSSMPRASSMSDACVAHLSLMLLPDCGPSLSASTHRASAFLWREFEALRVFMQSIPDAVTRTQHQPLFRHATSFAATTRAKLCAAALRRSRWLTTLAQLQSSMDSHATAAAQLRFLRTSTADSFSWAGFVSADWADHRTTRTTLLFLARLKPYTSPSRSYSAQRLHRCGRSVPESAVCAQSLLSGMRDSNASRNANTTGPKHGLLLSAGAATASLLSSDGLRSPRPSASAPHPHTRPASHSNRNTERIARDTLLLQFDEHSNSSPEKAERSTHDAAAEPAKDKHVGSGSSSVVELAAPQGPALQQTELVKDLMALVTSLQLYTSTLEAEVRELRRRLTCHDASESIAPHNVSSTRTAPTARQSQHPQREESLPDESLVSLNACTSTAPTGLPPLVEAAAMDLRADQAFPAALHPKLDLLLHTVVEAQGAVLRNTRLASPVVARSSSHGVEELQLKVALYERRLALMDHYVTPELTRCVDEIDHCLQPRTKR